MSIYGAMFSGVSGLAAQSRSLGMISDNISNVNTIGYKGSKAQFSTLVTQGATRTSYTPGGVQTRTQQMVDRQGLLQASDSATDVAVSGNGFFVVNDSAAPTFGAGYQFTRAGSFAPDSEGRLRNTAGFYLQGWRLNPDGTYVNGGGGTGSVLTDLETVDVNVATGSVKSTESITVAANLPGAANVIAPAATTTITQSGTIGRSATLPNSTSQTVTIYDDTGAPYTVTLSYTQTAVGASATPGPAVAVGWDAQVTAITDATGANALTAAHTAIPLTYDFDSGALTSAASVNIDFNALTTGPSFNAGGNIAMSMAGTVSTASSTNVAAAVDGSASLAYSALGDTSPMTVQIFDSLGVAYNVTLRYVKSGVTTGSPQTATWDIYVQNVTEVSTGNSLPGSPSNPSNPGTWGAPIGNVTFNEVGQMVSTSDQGAPAAGDPLTVTMDMTPFTLSNGATWVNTGTNAMTINVGNAQSLGGLTQFSSEYIVNKIDQDGVQFGAFAGVEIDELGFVTALFTNGRQLRVYQVPLATFPNANGLKGGTGNVYQQTDESGAYFLRESSQGGAGNIIASALESSTVDLATEFTAMIVTQRAYSASAKIITTSDEMLDELIRIKR